MVELPFLKENEPLWLPEMWTIVYTFEKKISFLIRDLQCLWFLLYMKEQPITSLKIQTMHKDLRSLTQQLHI